MIENRLVGIKSRECYEVPGGLALICAHKALEDLCLERELLHYKLGAEQKWAELVYYGLWYSPLTLALNAFFDATQQSVTGEVKLRFLKGTCTVVGRRSEHSLYDYNLATYDEGDTFNRDSAAGFIEQWGLPSKVWAKKRKDAGVEGQILDAGDDAAPHRLHPAAGLRDRVGRVAGGLRAALVGVARGRARGAPRLRGA